MRTLARAAMVVVILATMVPAARARTAQRDAVDLARAGAWLARQQTSSGRFGSDSQSPDGVAEAIASLVEAGVRGEPIARALEVIERDGGARGAERAAYAGRIVLGLHAAGLDPRSFAGTDYVRMIEQAQHPVTGELDEGLYAHAVAALGLAAGRGTLPEPVVRYMRANECRDGGLGHQRGCLGGADTDTTSMTIAALRAGGVDGQDPLVTRARAFLARAQNDDGGFGLTPGAPTNANSTGLAISALSALGEDVRARAWQQAHGGPLEMLAALQLSGGGFRYLAGDQDADLYATVQAIPGGARAAYPIEPRARPRVLGATRDHQPMARERDITTASSTRPSDGRPAEARIARDPRSLAIESIPGTGGRARTGPIAAAAGLLVIVAAGRAARTTALRSTR